MGVKWLHRPEPEFPVCEVARRAPPRGLELTTFLNLSGRARAVRRPGRDWNGDASGGQREFLETGTVVTAWSQAVCSWHLVERDSPRSKGFPAQRVSPRLPLLRWPRSRPGELQERVGDLTSRCVGDAYGALCSEMGWFLPRSFTQKPPWAYLIQ